MHVHFSLPYFQSVGPSTGDGIEFSLPVTISLLCTADSLHWWALPD